MNAAATALLIAVLIFMVWIYGIRNEPARIESRTLPSAEIQAEQSGSEVPVGKSESLPAAHPRSEYMNANVVTSNQVLTGHGIDIESFEEVTNALLDPDSTLIVRENAAAFLAKSDFPEAGKALASAIGIEDDTHSRAVVRAMYKVKHEEVMTAMRTVALSDRTEELRTTAIARLVQNGDREVVQTLALSIEENESIRSQAIFGHALVWDDADEALLMSLIDDPSHEVRAASLIVMSGKGVDIKVNDLIEVANLDSLRLETVVSLATEVSRRVSNDAEKRRSLSEIQRELRNKSRAELLADLENMRVDNKP